MLRYHARTFTLLGLEPRVSSKSIAALKQVEQRIRRDLPASVREWYEQEDACQLLLEYSNGDPSIAIEELGRPLRETQGGGPHDLLSRDLLPFRFENQGVCVWAVQLDGSDDPPVVVDVDTQFKRWLPCAASFSEHIYASVWDYALVLREDLLIQAQSPPLSKESLKFLNARFEAGPVTHGWPGDTQYRFSRGDQRVLIWASNQSADWYLSSDAEGSLADLASAVAACEQVGKSFCSNSDEADAALKRFRDHI